MKKKLKTSKLKIRKRNLLHDHPMLKKGGTHQKSNKSKRRLDKVNLHKEWLPQNKFYEQFILRKPFNYIMKLKIDFKNNLLLQTI